MSAVGGLSLSLLAIYFAQRPPTPPNTYGYLRTEILAALANGVALFLVADYILYKTIERVWAPPQVLSAPMFVIALIGLAVNLLGMVLLRRRASESMNLRGAYLDLLSDALGSVGVIVAGHGDQVVAQRTRAYGRDETCSPCRPSLENGCPKERISRSDEHGRVRLTFVSQLGSARVRQSSEPALGREL